MISVALAAYKGEKYIEQQLRSILPQLSHGDEIIVSDDAPGGMSEELKEIYGGIGVEYCYNQQFSLRGGYHYENEFKGNRKYYTLGAGFRMSVFSLDAAYLISAAQSNPLDQTLRFSLSFDMDGLRDLFRRY